ncbi:MAG: protein translocase subunit SecF [Myxococcota bacterium]|jgi:preprotein translocase subunit SecF|nr:protein translocase subunit SecF [Myxococcota bacterium]
MKIIPDDFNFDFMGRIGLFRFVSGTLMVASITSFIVFGLNLGIDFAGGYEIQVGFPEKVSESQIKDLIKPLKVGDVRVQRFGSEEENSYLIMARKHGTIGDELKRVLKSDFEGIAAKAGSLSNWSIAESGERLVIGFDHKVSQDLIRAAVEKHGLLIKDITANTHEEKSEFVVSLVSLADQVEGALVAGLDFGPESNIVQRVEFVGPQVGKELRNQGFLAVLYALGFILLYIAMRFDLFFSPGAILALVHDVLAILGLFSIFQLEFNLPIIAAILALVGYSLNDTIVVYDRIRENLVRFRGRELGALINTSLNQTLSRTILTSLTTLLVVSALWVLGGGIIRDFAIALFAGVIIGTYSSVAIASPTYLWLRKRQAAKDSPGDASVVTA